MDLFRYFHPHHNPRLRKVPPRLQELGELELAAKELLRALQRTQIRSSTAADPKVQLELDEALLGMSMVVKALGELVQAHPGDSAETVATLIEERKSIPGWENWARIVRERLENSLIERRAAS